MADVTPSNWQPIGTAPKNGDCILVFDFHYDGAGMCVVYWDQERGWVSTEDSLTSHAVPTHWMPLPEPPDNVP
jgi:hypothetical protein